MQLFPGMFNWLKEVKLLSKVRLKEKILRLTETSGVQEIPTYHVIVQ